jgi:hypothetical protein
MELDWKGGEYRRNECHYQGQHPEAIKPTQFR